MTTISHVDHKSTIPYIPAPPVDPVPLPPRTVALLETCATDEPSRERSLDDLLRRIQSDIDARTAERDAAVARLRREIEEVRRACDGEVGRLRGLYDYARGYSARAAVGGGADVPGRLPDGWVIRETLRFAAEAGRFFHVTELDERLAARVGEDFPGSGLEPPGRRALRKTLEELRGRGDLARARYGTSTRHRFHGAPDLVRPGPDGLRYASPRAAPLPGLLDGAGDEPPAFG